MDAKSATAVVQIVRRCFDEFGDLRWCAEALYQIAKRSTARTRKEWSKDPLVEKLADSLRKEADSEAPLAGRVDRVELILLVLEALRRMSLQATQEQKPALERIVTALVADQWKHPVKSIGRLFWLAAPLKLSGIDGVPMEIRERAALLDGPDVALIIQAMRNKDSRDSALLLKVVARLKTEGVHVGLSATDLVEMAEGLRELGAHDEAALRPLGQEILRRRGELTPDESHRAHGAFNSMKLPLPQVWTQPGAAKKRDKAQILTTQTFVPQEGHEKKRRGNHDIERTSPPRVVRDYKMMSY